MPRTARYSRLQITLHWLVAVLIAAAWFTHDQMRRREGETAEGVWIAGLPLHVWLGLAVFVLVLVRIALRLSRGAPGPDEASHPVVAMAAAWGHRLLYALMVLVPLAGMSRAFLGIEAAGEAHEVLANALVVLALGHALVALFHQYVLKDGTLLRMTRGGT